MKLTKQHTIFKWKQYKNIEIPEGLRVKFLPDPTGGRYVLDQSLHAIAAKHSSSLMLAHDAIHYGITIHASQLKEC